MADLGGNIRTLPIFQHFSSKFLSFNMADLGDSENAIYTTHNCCGPGPGLGHKSYLRAGPGPKFQARAGPYCIQYYLRLAGYPASPGRKGGSEGGEGGGGRVGRGEREGGEGMAGQGRGGVKCNDIK